MTQFMQRLVEWMQGVFIYHYNHKSYWKKRNIVVNSNSKYPKLIKILLLIQLRKSDAYNGAEIATGLNGGAMFKSPPNLPHRLNGIIIHPTARIGANCTILQQVTIGTRNINKSAVIGDDVFIGAGAKILGDITIGNGAKIGANSVVLCDVPTYTTVVGIPAKIIARNEQESEII